MLFYISLRVGRAKPLVWRAARSSRRTLLGLSSGFLETGWVHKLKIYRRILANSFHPRNAIFEGQISGYMPVPDRFLGLTNFRTSARALLIPLPTTRNTGHLDVLIFPCPYFKAGGIYISTFPYRYNILQYSLSLHHCCECCPHAHPLSLSKLP